MKKFMLPISVVLEYFVSLTERFLHRKQKPSFMALSVVEFTQENWLDGVVRQGRILDHLYYYNQNN
jgi:hypothetical protein